MEQLLSAHDTLWTWGIPTVLGLTAIVLTVRLRAPQLRLVEGFRAVTGYDARAEGTLAPGSAVLLSTAATHGTAAAVSAATAVALGGAGAVAWLWLFGLLIAPLRYAEVLLARTAPPGQAGQAERGSLAKRLVSDASPAVRALGWALTALVPLTAFAYVGGAHGVAAMDAAERLLPGSALSVGVAVAIFAALVVLPALGRPARGAVAIGWLALASLVMLLSVTVVACAADPGRAFGAIVRALGDAFSGAQNVGAFAGALAGEIAGVAMLTMLPALASTTGVDGAIHGAAQAPTARGQAAAALLGPLAHVVLVTLLAFSFIATGTFHRRTEDTRRLDEVTFWSSGFETPSQRIETDRRFTGLIRVIDGAARARPLELGTERGMVTSPRFVAADGSPADFAVRLVDGRVVTYLEPTESGTLDQRPLSTLSSIVVEGRMLPRGGALLVASMQRGGGDAASRIALTTLLFLAALGAAGWGLGAAKSVPASAAMIVAFLPALGLLLAATGVAPWLSTVGSLLAGLLVVVASIGLLLKVGEVAGVIATTTKRD